MFKKWKETTKKKKTVTTTTACHWLECCCCCFSSILVCNCKMQSSTSGFIISLCSRLNDYISIFFSLISQFDTFDSVPRRTYFTLSVCCDAHSLRLQSSVERQRNRRRRRQRKKKRHSQQPKDSFMHHRFVSCVWLLMISAHYCLV